MAEQVQHAKEVASHKADETKQYGQQKAGEAQEQSQGNGPDGERQGFRSCSSNTGKDPTVKDNAAEGLSHAGEALKGAMGKVTGNNEGGAH
ncbi:hypothetical protein KP509_27G045700 [Ceratopteris richardii]|uniref:Uncharacterized protein n=1 Tax=Ceratopteris richardii TaxID=49495 RepID=A0A8T2RIP7_CERRI|nr:hypothetical protein KP509_27G045700 [Ceratopteris richardii]